MVDVIKFAQTGLDKARSGASQAKNFINSTANSVRSVGDGAINSANNFLAQTETSINGALSSVAKTGPLGKMAATAGGAVLSGTAAKVGGALSDAVSSVTGGLGGLLGGGSGSDTAGGAASEYGISREAWDVRSGKTTTPIAFNVNPSSVDFNFQGRGASSLTSTGRVFDRFVANANQGQMIFDLSFQMQTGSLLSPEMKATAGHKVLHGIMELLNEPLRLEDGSVNLQVLRINTVRYGYMELTGLFSMESGLALSESADDPFKGDYMLTFQVVHSSPPITLAASLIQSVEKAGYD